MHEIYEMDVFYFMDVLQEEKEEVQERSLFAAFGK